MAIGSSGSEPGDPLLPHNPLPRYGQETWSQWRKTGLQYGNPRPPRILELEGRRISSGFYSNGTGELMSLVVETLGGEQEVAGEHVPYEDKRNLIESPPSVEPPLHLTHLSGDEKKDNWSVVFHYE